jgi:hypothetical protein
VGTHTVLERAEFLYQAFYCEENVFHLSRDPRFAARSPSAVFVTGAGGECVMWHQKAARRPGAPLSWDYHVFLIVRDPWEIWDLDTVLGLPVPAATYLRLSFRPEVELPEELSPVFRVVGSGELLETFSSDRSHMRGPDGRYQKPPPPWPPIGPSGAPSRLDRYLDMSDGVAGEVMNLEALLVRVSAGGGGSAPETR